MEILEWGCSVFKKSLQIQKNSYQLYKTEKKKKWRIHPFPKLWNTTTPFSTSFDSYCKNFSVIQPFEGNIHSLSQQSGQVTLVFTHTLLTQPLKQSSPTASPRLRHSSPSNLQLMLLVGSHETVRNGRFCFMSFISLAALRKRGRKGVSAFHIF